MIKFYINYDLIFEPENSVDSFHNLKAHVLFLMYQVKIFYYTYFQSDEFSNRTRNYFHFSVVRFDFS